MACGNGISGLLNFKHFWRSMPPGPPSDSRLGRSSSLPPHTQMSSYGHARVAGYGYGASASPVQASHLGSRSRDASARFRWGGAATRSARAACRIPVDAPAGDLCQTRVTSHFAAVKKNAFQLLALARLYSLPVGVSGRSIPLGVK